VPLRVQHVHGPRSMRCAATDLIALSVVKDGELHIRSFLEHHFALGVAHVVILLNDSNDRTEEIAAQYERVTILRCSWPYRLYEVPMKRYLVRRFANRRWSLFVDVDELFDYPGRDRVSLRQLVEYLDAHRYTAVVAHMLDMFSDGPLACVRSAPEDRLWEHHRRYDISMIDRQLYRWSALSEPAVKLYVGGIRLAAFGTRNWLTKAPLVKAVSGVVPFVEWHQVHGAQIADFTGLLLHYPFVEGFASKVDEAVAARRYTSAGDEYLRYAQVLKSRSELVLSRSPSLQLDSIDQLVESGFLVVGPGYSAFSAKSPPASDGGSLAKRHV